MWSDRPGRPLEDQLNDVIRGLVVASGVLQMWRIKRQEAQQRRQAAELERLEREERKREEARRLNVLFEQVNSWRQAANIRAFVHAVRAALELRGNDVEPGRLEAWASWALRRADHIDPLHSKDPIGLDPISPSASEGGKARWR